MTHVVLLVVHPSKVAHVGDDGLGDVDGDGERAPKGGHARKVGGAPLVVVRLEVLEPQREWDVAHGRQHLRPLHDGAGLYVQDGDLDGRDAGLWVIPPWRKDEGDVLAVLVAARDVRAVVTLMRVLEHGEEPHWRRRQVNEQGLRLAGERRRDRVAPRQVVVVGEHAHRSGDDAVAVRVRQVELKLREALGRKTRVRQVAHRRHLARVMVLHCIVDVREPYSPKRRGW